MGLLEIAAADFRGGDLGCDRQHRNTAPMRVEKAVDQVQIAGAAGASTHRKAAGHLGFAGSGRDGSGAGSGDLNRRSMKLGLVARGLQPSRSTVR